MDWLYQLENYALKKQASEELFRQIREELEDVLGDKTSDDYKFTIEQVRAKLKWFKKEWRSIDNKIICGSGLGRKNTKVPKCYDIMNPQFCDAVDDITSLRVFSFLSYYTRRFAVLKFISDRFSV